MLIDSCSNNKFCDACNCKLCSFGDFFVELVSTYVKIISIATMTNIRFNGSTGFDSSKRTTGTMFRPKSSRYESRKMSIKHRNSLDSSDNPCDQLLHKRSNSLQSLTSVDNQAIIEERTKLAAKPRKIAWASRTCSEDGASFEDSTAGGTWNPPCEMAERIEPCLEYNKTKLEESKKKSIDIFLSRNFIDPIDILPSHRNSSRFGLLKSFGSSFASATISVDRHDESFVDDQKSADLEEAIPMDTKCEKKVTFAADLSKTTTSSAETRRMNFRNSYSKRSTAGGNFSFTSSSRLERQTSAGKCPTTKAEQASTVKRGNSTSSFAENADEVTTAAAVVCSPTATSPSASPLPPMPMQMPPLSSPLFKQPVMVLTTSQQQIDKNKQLTAKRKLKSCRSRSFHKSLDNSSIIENLDTFSSFAKPLKSNQNSDVVTMVSLIVSNDDDSAPAAAAAAAGSQPAGKPDSATSAKENVDNKLEKQTKTGILKSKWQSENVKRASTQPTQKRRFINTSNKLLTSPEKTRTILTAVDNLTNAENERVGVPAVTNTTLCEKNDNESEDTESKSDKSFQSAKEQECWSSFRKMTNKGFSVSFDTILRGLLTPTEYRLRKSELLTQEA